MVAKLKGQMAEQASEGGDAVSATLQPMLDTLTAAAAHADSIVDEQPAQVCVGYRVA